MAILRSLGVVGLALLCLAAPSPAGDRKPSRYFSPELEKLEMLYGLWKVTVHHYDTEGERIATVEGKENVTWILDDRAIQREYQTGQGPNTYQALGTLTWNSAEKKYHGVWFDTVSTTGPTSVTGYWDEGARAFVFHAESRAKDGSMVQYRIEDRLIDTEKRIATTYLLDGDRRTKLLETHYQRATPCPGRLRSMEVIPP